MITADSNYKRPVMMILAGLKRHKFYFSLKSLVSSGNPVIIFSHRERRMVDHIGKEKAVHGQHWGAVHGGYFSNPAIAQPLVETVKGILAESPADVVVDFGGGTGYLLSLLALHGIGAGAELVNVDCSETQLALTNKKGISTICASISSFRRGDIAAEDKRFFFMMRSVLHYHGEKGLQPLLRRLRDQAKKGEFFAHQSASFDNEEEAACLNFLYRQMRTGKWYTTIDDLKDRLAESGWLVTATTPAPPLLLTSDELARRYALDTNDIARIRSVMATTFSGMDRVFRLTPSGFQADLHYKIYTCAAEK
jgi:hypothetical protein